MASDGELYLDGRYFDIVMSSYLGKMKKSYNINLFVDQTTAKVLAETDLFSDINDRAVGKNPQGIYLARLVLNIFAANLSDSRGFDGVSNDPNTKLVSRHSNLLIINEKSMTVSRFEPISEAPYDKIVNTLIMGKLSKISYFRGFKYQELILHPQNLNSNKGLCVSYVLKLSLAIAANQPISMELFGSESDMLEFSKQIVAEYGNLPVENADVEFGFGGFAGGALLGLGLGVGALGLAGAFSPQTTIIYR